MVPDALEDGAENGGKTGPSHVTRVSGLKPAGTYSIVPDFSIAVNERLQGFQLLILVT